MKTTSLSVEEFARLHGSGSGTATHDGLWEVGQIGFMYDNRTGAYAPTILLVKKFDHSIAFAYLTSSGVTVDPLGCLSTRIQGAVAAIREAESIVSDAMKLDKTE